MFISYMLSFDPSLSFLIDPHNLIIMPHPTFLDIFIHSMINFILRL